MTAPPVNFRRREYGRGHAYFVDDEKVPGVTTIIGAGVPKTLQYSAAELVARHAVEHPDYFPSVPDGGLRDAAVAVFQGAWRESSDRGTRTHDLVARLAVGEVVDVPDDLTGMVASYLRFVEEWRPEALYVEAPILSLDPRYAGTVDLIAELDGGPLALIDFKTGPSGVWPEVALQLAAYKRAGWVLRDGALEELPRVDLTLAVWLQDDTYRVLPVDTGPEVWRGFLAAMDVARFAKTERDSIIGAPLAPPREAVA